MTHPDIDLATTCEAVRALHWSSLGIRHETAGKEEIGSGRLGEREGGRDGRGGERERERERGGGGIERKKERYRDIDR